MSLITRTLLAGEGSRQKTEIEQLHSSAVVCTDLSDKEPHRQVGVGRVVTSGGLGGVIVSILSQNARDVDSIPTLGTLFPISSTLQHWFP